MKPWVVDINLRHNFVLHKQSLSDKMFTTIKESVFSLPVYLNILHLLQSGGTNMIKCKIIKYIITINITYDNNSRSYYFL